MMRRMKKKPVVGDRVGLDLEVLARPIRLDLSLNDLRILVGCFRALAWQAEADDEPYLDADGIELMQKLELAYRKSLEKAGAGPGGTP